MKILYGKALLAKDPEGDSPKSVKFDRVFVDGNDAELGMVYTHADYWPEGGVPGSVAFLPDFCSAFKGDDGDTLGYIPARVWSCKHNGPFKPVYRIDQYYPVRSFEQDPSCCHYKMEGGGCNHTGQGKDCESASYRLVEVGE